MNSDARQSDPVVQLNYGVAPSPWRRRTRRTLAVLILGGLIIAGWRWGPSIVHQATLLYWQRQCLNYSPPADQIVYEQDPTFARQLLAQPSYFQSHSRWEANGTGIIRATPPPIAAFQPQALIEFLQRSGIPFGYPETQLGAVFVGRIRTPSSGARLLVIRALPLVPAERQGPATHWSLILHLYKPATIFDPPQAVKFSLEGLFSPQRYTRIWAGQIDPNDPSRFSFRVRTNSLEQIIRGRIDDGDHIKFEIWPGPTTSAKLQAPSRP